MKKWFTLNRVQELVNLACANVQLLGFKPTRGDFTPDCRMNDQIRGVHLWFRNGVTLSVQWSRQNYCDGGVTSCEVMAMDEEMHPICIPGHLQPDDYDHVIGHVDQEDLLLIIKECASMKEKIRKKVGGPIL